MVANSFWEQLYSHSAGPAFPVPLPVKRVVLAEGPAPKNAQQEGRGAVVEQARLSPMDEELDERILSRLRPSVPSPAPVPVSASPLTLADQVQRPEARQATASG
jgi:hypothetical protein